MAKQPNPGQKVSKNLAAIFILIICAAFVLVIKMVLDYSGAPDQGQNLRAKGNLNAPLQIVEFIDFQCPACAKGAQYLKTFMTDHPDVVYLEMKYFPLGMHRHAVMSSRYAECASQQGKFWPFHDALVEKQHQWKNLISAMPAFDVMADNVEIDRTQLNACLKDESIDALIIKDKNEGESYGIKSTPTYFINGEMVVGLKSLKEVLNKHLEEKK